MLYSLRVYLTLFVIVVVVVSHQILNFMPVRKSLYVLFSFVFPAPDGHTSASVIPLIKVGRGMYSVMHNNSGVTRFLVCQISSVEGSKYIKIRSPFQVCRMIIPIMCISSRVITVSCLSNYINYKLSVIKVTFLYKSHLKKRSFQNALQLFVWG